MQWFPTIETLVTRAGTQVPPNASMFALDAQSAEPCNLGLSIDVTDGRLSAPLGPESAVLQCGNKDLTKQNSAGIPLHFLLFWRDMRQRVSEIRYEWL